MVGVAVLPYNVSLPLAVGLVVVPGLISVRVGLPCILQCCVDQSLADQDAQVDDQVGIH